MLAILLRDVILSRYILQNVHDKDELCGSNVSTAHNSSRFNPLLNREGEEENLM